jgi:hypothetical protein
MGPLKEIKQLPDDTSRYESCYNVFATAFAKRGSGMHGTKVQPCWIVSGVVLALALAACTDDNSRDLGPGTDVDTDTDSDADTDSDGGSDGGDTDTDSDSETDWGCPDGDLVWEGNYSATTSADISALFGYSEIHGDLILSGEELTNLDGLECLKNIDGSLFMGWVSWAWDWYSSDCEQFGDGGTGIVDVAGLLNLSSISGSLVISGNDNISDIDGLNSLETVGGQLQITFNSSLGDVSGLNSLQTVGSHVGILSNYSLVSLNGLTSLHSIGGDLSVGKEMLLLNPSSAGDSCPAGRGNQSLMTMTGLTGLQSVGGGVYIVGNDSLINIDGLVGLTTIGTDPDLDHLVSIGGNGALTSISGLQGLGPTLSAIIVISANAALTSAEGLNNIEYLDGSLTLDGPFSDLSALNNLVGVTGGLAAYSLTANDLGLDSLESVEGLIYFYDCNNIFGLTSLSNLASAGGLSIYHCDALSNLDGLASLTYAGSIDINSNSSLLNLDGLGGLTSLDTGGLGINGNPSLGNIDGLQSITDILGDIHVRDNDSLNDLDALFGLTSFSGAWFFVHENANIPTCDAIGLRDLVTGLGWTGDVCIQNNLMDACVEDVSGCV